VSAYRFPTPLLLRIAASVVRGTPRSVGADSAGGLRGAVPPPCVLGTEHLPARGPYIVVGNHYERPGLWAGWGTMIVAASVRAALAGDGDLHWLMTDELLDARVGPLVVPRRWVRGVLSRFARMYGFGLVSARESGEIGGVAGPRAAARYLEAGAPVGVLPEGTASVALCEARPGVGTFLAWLTRGGVPLIPVAVFEQADILTAIFGPPFHLSALSVLAAERVARDAALRSAIMLQIARLLPPELRGVYTCAAEADPG
jgi:hypothetical protein